MSGYDDLNNLSPAAPNWLAAFQSFAAQIQADVATLLGGAVTDALVYGASSPSSAVDIQLTALSDMVQNVTMTVASKAMLLPSATTLVAGKPFVICNAGSNAFAIKDYEATVVVANLAAGQTAFIRAVDITTAAGVWHSVVLNSAPADSIDAIARDINTLQSWAIAVLEGQTAMSAVGQVVDVFSAETYVDTVTSTNETYDAVGDLYTNFGNSSASASNISTTSGTGWTSTGIRQLINAAGLSASGVRVAVKLRSSDTQGLTVLGCKIGKKAAAGNAWDFDGNEVSVTFNGGAAGFTIGTASSITSDYVDFALDETQDYIIAFAISNAVTSGVHYTPVLANWTGYIKATTGYLDATNTAPTGYSVGDSQISVQEVLVKPLTAMNLISKAFTASSTPSELRGLFDIDKSASAVLNTDIVGKVSRDGGTTWSTLILTEVSKSSATRSVYAATGDVSWQPSGTAVKIRLDTTATYAINLHQWAVMADVVLTL